MKIPPFKTLSDPSKLIYFASDFHLGIPNYAESLEREKKLIRWLHHAAAEKGSIYLLGDLFDFWFEYKRAVPKYFVRLLGTMAELTDAGVTIKMFTGNHDMWLFDYFPNELGIQIFNNPIMLQAQGKQLYIGHGDGLGPGDKGYKFIKKIFASKACQWFFARMHPNLGIGMAQYWSGKSRAQEQNVPVFENKEHEWLYLFSKEFVNKYPETDFIVMGHRHLTLDLEVAPNKRYINTGTWLDASNYALLKDGEIQLHIFTG